MAEEARQPLLSGKAEEPVADFTVWKSEAWDVCKLAGPACLQLFFQARALFRGMHPT